MFLVGEDWTDRFEGLRCIGMESASGSKLSTFLRRFLIE